ncbi:unnamed protein product [Arabis nemorensis]|uniref:Vps52 coiled-coil domain-containing protein n=1 Tax=Arabis nemorensis TaxID=586526 RepID=A0A565AZS6_9BRAS|nr:unnamed protein product [Arabis nemorensis]
MGNLSNPEKHLGAFVGDLAFEDDSGSEDISLDGLQQELEVCQSDEDYIKESDNLVSLHDQLRDCDGILCHKWKLSSVDFRYLTFISFEGIGSISSDIKILQEKSVDMGLRLKNRRVAESKLAKFVEDIIVPPKMIDVIVDGEVNEEYMKTLELLSKKLKFVEADQAVKSFKALKDVEPELGKLRQKAISKLLIVG